MTRSWSGHYGPGSIRGRICAERESMQCCELWARSAMVDSSADAKKMWLSVGQKGVNESSSTVQPTDWRLKSEIWRWLCKGIGSTVEKRHPTQNGRCFRQLKSEILVCALWKQEHVLVHFNNLLGREILQYDLRSTQQQKKLREMNLTMLK